MKKPIRLISVILIFCLCISLLTACNSSPSSNSENNNSGMSSNPEISASQTEIADTTEESQSSQADEATEDSTPQLTLDPSVEPPLDKYSLAAAVPNFLDEEQQNLYRRAYCLFPVFDLNTECIDDFSPLDGADSSDSPSEMVINGNTYVLSVGRYQNWDDFEATSLSIFTSDYYDTLIGLDDDILRFCAVDGNVYYLPVARGSAMWYYGSNADTFELISKTDEEIRFNVNGHYYTDAEETTDENGQISYVFSGEEMKSFPITMVKTESGWRFSEFSLAY